MSFRQENEHVVNNGRAKARKTFIWEPRARVEITGTSTTSKGSRTNRWGWGQLGNESDFPMECCFGRAEQIIIHFVLLSYGKACGVNELPCRVVAFGTYGRRLGCSGANSCPRKRYESSQWSGSLSAVSAPLWRGSSVTVIWMWVYVCKTVYIFMPLLPLNEKCAKTKCSRVKGVAKIISSTCCSWMLYNTKYEGLPQAVLCKFYGKQTRGDCRIKYAHLGVQIIEPWCSTLWTIQYAVLLHLSRLRVLPNDGNHSDVQW